MRGILDGIRLASDILHLLLLTLFSLSEALTLNKALTFLDRVDEKKGDMQAKVRYGYEDGQESEVTSKSEVLVGQIREED